MKEKDDRKHEALKGSQGVSFANRDPAILGTFRMKCRIAYGVAALSILAAVLYTSFMADTLSRKRGMFVMDLQGNIVYGKEKGLTPQSELFFTTAEVITEIIFERGPKGLLKEHRVDDLFELEAKKKLEADVQKQMPELVNKSMHQHPEIRDIKYLHTKNQVIVYHVTGQLIRNSTFEGAAIPEPTVKYTLALGLRKNTNLLTNKRWPYVLVAWDRELEALDK